MTYAAVHSYKTYFEIAPTKGSRLTDDEIKRLSQNRVGSNYSFETLDAIGRYYKKANQIIKENGIYKDGKRQAFGVVFEPQYKKNGELKDFKYVRSAWFDENKVK